MTTLRQYEQERATVEVCGPEVYHCGACDWLYELKRFRPSFCPHCGMKYEAVQNGEKP